MEFGGIHGARLLAFRVALDPSKFLDTSNRLLRTSRQDDITMAVFRAEFADALMKQPRSPETQTLGLMVFRPLFERSY